MKTKPFICALLLLCKVATSQTIHNIYVAESAIGKDDGTSWVNAYKFLSSAIEAAHSKPDSDSVTIHVVNGTYYPTGKQSATNRDLSFAITRGRLAVLGGYPRGGGAREATMNITILSGDIGTANDSIDNSYHVMLIVGFTDKFIGDITIDGFTIANGNANGDGDIKINEMNINQSDGGGIANSMSTTTIAHCNFKNNAAFDGGGLYNKYSSATLTDCHFENNSADNGGGISNYFAAPTIAKCSFENNTATSGGGINNIISSPIIKNCYFYKNNAEDGGGILNTESSSKITDCLFEKNSSKFGGGIDNLTSSPIIIDCHFRKNTSVYGGGIYNLESSPIVTYCRFENNTASRGGGINSFDSKSIMQNCIFYGNIASSFGDVDDFGAGVGSAYYCSIAEEFPEDGDSETVEEYGDGELLINCTMVGNKSEKDVTVFLGGGGKCYIFNSIIYGYPTGGIKTGDESGSIFIVKNSLIQGEKGGVDGNLPGTTDALFVDPANNDFHLKPASPCINKGSNVLMVLDLTEDYDGVARILHDVVDMGAFEQ